MKKILAISEDRGKQSAIESSLKKKIDDGKWEVIKVVNGTPGIKALDKEKPDLTFLDLSAANSSGFEVLHHVHRKKRATRIIGILTSNLPRESLMAIFHIGKLNSSIDYPFDSVECFNLTVRVLSESTLYPPARTTTKRKLITEQAILDNVINKFPPEEQKKILTEIVEHLPGEQLERLVEQIKS